MSTENTSLPTATHAAQPAVKKTVRKAVKKAPRKTPAKAPVKVTPNLAPRPVKRPASQKATTPTKKATPQPKIKAAPTAQTVVEEKHKKPKLVRDSFTFPKDEYQAIAGLKQKALGLKHSAKKSEILRAGLKLLSSLNDKAFLAALTNVPALKTGRPAKS